MEARPEHTWAFLRVQAGGGCGWAQVETGLAHAEPGARENVEAALWPLLPVLLDGPSANLRPVSAFGPAFAPVL